jgi:hypothetical protein
MRCFRGLVACLTWLAREQAHLAQVRQGASASPRADDYNERNSPFTRQIDNVTVERK